MRVEGDLSEPNRCKEITQTIWIHSGPSQYFLLTQLNSNQDR